MLSYTIGLQVPTPKQSCNDLKCPFHGEITVRKKVLQGRVVRVAMKKTVIVERDYAHYVPKFLRYKRHRSRIPAHNPPCLGVHEGDIVRVAECRPLSKTVAHVVIERIASEGAAS